MKKFVLAALAASSVVAIQPASATVTILDSPGDISTSYLNDFETAANSGPVTFTTGSIILASNANSGGPVSGNGFGISPPGTIEALLSGYYTEVGMFFGNDDRCCVQSTSAIVSIFDGTTFLGSVSLAANMNDLPDQFIGLSSTQAFNRVVFNYADNNLFRYIDNFQLGPAQAAAVPEPSTWAMMLLGFGAVGLGMRRSNRRKRDLLQIA